MSDSSELDYLRTFLTKILTESTVKHIEEHGSNILDIDGNRTALVWHGELLDVSSNRYIKRYKVEINEASATGLKNTFGKLIDGINEFQRGVEISGYSKPPTFIWIELASSNRGGLIPIDGERILQLTIDCKFTTG